jgi:carboxypeptidase family protein
MVGLTGTRCRVMAALFALALIAAPELAWAQAGTAGLSGTVKDSQGAVIPGATVTASNPATGALRSTTTNEDGIYNLPGLPPGTYTVKIELAGFKALQHDNVPLRVDTTTNIDAVLAPGNISETVTVKESTPIINTTDASVGNTLSQQTIERLPVEGRNVVHLLSLQPGAVFIPTANGNTVDPRYGAVAGSRADQQNVTLDGVDVNDPQLQAAYTSAVRLTQDSLQEFRVSTTNYSAEAGRSSGAQVSLVTKSGTNQYNGAGYWVGRRTDQSSNEYFNKLAQVLAGKPSVAPKLNKDFLGASLGGPVRRNKFFFFGNYEKFKENSETPVVRSVPSPSFRDGIIQYQCATAALCPGGTVRGFNNTHTIAPGWYGLSPAEIAAIDPLGIGPSRAASTYFAQYPVPNEPGLDGKNIMDFRFAAPIQNNFNTTIGRVDYRLSDNKSLFARFNIQDDTINSAPSFPGEPSSTQTLRNNNGFAIGYDSALSPSLVNSFRYGLTAIDDATVGQRKESFVTFRFITNYVSTSSSSTRETPTHNIVDDLSWLKGTHTFKFGTNLRFTRIPSTRNSGSFNTATINPSWVSGVGQTYMPGRPGCTTPGCSAVPAVASTFFAGYADSWLNSLGVISQANLNANYDRQGNSLPTGEPVSRRYASDEYEFYTQDSWRVRSNLTVTAGLRYSLYTPPYEANGLQVAPTISMGKWFADRAAGMLKGVPSNQSPMITFDLAGPKNGKKGFYEMDKNNFAPRLAVAWSPHAEGGVFGWLTGGDRMVVRGGYSKVYDRIGQGLALNFDNGFSFGMSTSISSPFGADYETNPAVRFSTINALPPTVPAAPKGGFPQTPPVRAGIITTSIDDTLVTPSAHMANFIVGRELRGSFAFEGGYIGRFGRDLLNRRDIAMPLNLVDTKSGMDYFTAAQQIIKATQALGIPAGAATDAYQAVANIPYWENLFPAAANRFPGVLSASQAFARQFNRDGPDYITTLWRADQFCNPGCSIHGPFAYFADQYDSLAAISSVGRSNYHSMVLTLRKRYNNGYQFDLNYTLSQSKDTGSQVERGSAFGNFGNGGYTGFLLNSFDVDAHYATSDFDVRHQINFNYIWDLPFGRGKKFGGGANAFVNHIIGEWSIAGLTRWTSGFPFNVQNCRSCWPTNWNLQGNASLVTPGKLPATGLTMDAVDHRPSPFVNAADARTYFRFSYPGEVGLRNVLRGDGYFTIDTSLSKAWRIGIADHKIRFRWDVFNVTNTPSFDVGNVTMTPDRTGFGRYNGALAPCDGQAGRCMQFALRYEF